MVVTLNTTFGLVQLITPPVAVTVGIVVFWVTIAVAVLVQPLAVLVTVTVYVPASMTEGFCWLEEKPPGPDQAKAGWPALVLAVRPTLVTVQVNCPPVAVAVGGTMLEVTLVEAVEVQPLVLLVTISI